MAVPFNYSEGSVTADSTRAVCGNASTRFTVPQGSSTQAAVMWNSGTITQPLAGDLHLRFCYYLERLPTGDLYLATGRDPSDRPTHYAIARADGSLVSV